MDGHRLRGEALVAWGWDEAWQDAFAPLAGDGFVPARVVAQHRGQWVLVDGLAERQACPTGRFRHHAGEDGLPAVGDWVGCPPPEGSHETRFDAVLPRRSSFIRRAAGSRVGAQVVAANVDTLLVATSLNRDLNPRRLERYVAMGHRSGAEAVIVLTKADVATEPDAAAALLADQLGVAVQPVSAMTGVGLESLGRWLQPGRTVALVGSSGVGKSTLLNRLAGEELMATREIRADDARGRHATTHRELFRLPGGVLVVDTPGMRELGLWDAGVGIDEAFSEISALAAGCRFGDCGHEREPGCAIQAAIRTGDLDARRLRSYRRLRAEAEAQPSPAAQRERSRRFHKAVRTASVESMARKSYRETSTGWR